MLFENLPVALAAVDCDGNETSISECASNDGLIGMCTNITSSTVLACGNTVDGVFAMCKLGYAWNLACMETTLVWLVVSPAMLVRTGISDRYI